jgi:hypothetical protein
MVQGCRLRPHDLSFAARAFGDAVGESFPVSFKSSSKVTYPGVIPIHEELRFCAPGARADGGRVELIVDAALALRLLFQDVSASRLCERLDATRRPRPQPEQHERLVVRTACTYTQTHKQCSVNADCYGRMQWVD